MTTPTLIGRSSSHFSRVARIFAHEVDVRCEFRPVFDLTSLDPGVYGGNPALKIPVLVDQQGALFGAENICRELLRRSERPGNDVVLRGDCASRVVANAEELTLHAMGSGVALIMAASSGATQPAPVKVTESLQGGLRYLDDCLPAALAALPPERSVSFLEVTLYCLIRHLEFRGLAETRELERLCDFAARFDERPSAQATPYRFDAPPAK